MSEYVEYITRYERGENGTLIQRIEYGYEPIAERITRCRDCIDGANDGTKCTRTSILHPSKVEPDGFCKWGERKHD